MYCIAAFLIFMVLGVFSARYRRLAKKAWGCFARKITLRPCDTGLKEELKAKLLGRFVVTRPRFAKFLERWINVFAFLFVALSIWSIYAVAISGLNLYVYDTCNPNDVETCSLAGESCALGSDRMNFTQSLMSGNVLTWGAEEVAQLADTFSRIPDRLKTWDAAEYIDEQNTFYKPFDPSMPTALEIIDPGCIFCAKLFQNIVAAEFTDRYNLTYIPYVITDGAGTPRFRHSLIVVSYLVAVQLTPPENEMSSIPPDWQILEKMFTQTDEKGIQYQYAFNNLYTEEVAREVLAEFLRDAGYTDEQIVVIHDAINSWEVQERLNHNKRIVAEEIRTIKIPTIIFDGRRNDRLIGVDALK